MPKQTLEEKRLEALRRQLSGKSHLSVQTTKTTTGSATSQKFEFKATPISSSTSTLASDTSYLKKDLSKVFILSFLALAVQFSLYYLSLKHLINLNFLHF